MKAGFSKTLPGLPDNRYLARRGCPTGDEVRAFVSILLFFADAWVFRWGAIERLSN